jgi:hypothetical protein
LTAKSKNYLQLPRKSYDLLKREHFEDGELNPLATVRLFRTVQPEGRRAVERDVEHYNLDMVLALGYRVRSPVGVRFRQWATDKLKGIYDQGVCAG